jgi:predicted RNA binding protein YcfA (HicA-like mRNA interferase family)
MKHDVNKLIKRLENRGVIVRRAKQHGAHLIARNPKTGITTTIGVKYAERIGVESSFKIVAKTLLTSVA